MTDIFTYRPRIVPEQPEWQWGVFPYKSVNGHVVEWNSVVRRRNPGDERWQVSVLPPFANPDLAHANAENWIRARRGE